MLGHTPGTGGSGDLGCALKFCISKFLDALILLGWDPEFLHILHFTHLCILQTTTLNYLSMSYFLRVT